MLIISSSFLFFYFQPVSAWWSTDICEDKSAPWRCTFLAYLAEAKSFLQNHYFHRFNFQSILSTTDLPLIVHFSFKLKPIKDSQSCCSAAYSHYWVLYILYADREVIVDSAICGIWLWHNWAETFTHGATESPTNVWWAVVSPTLVHR